MEGTSGEGATEESQIGPTCEMKKEKVIQTYKNPAYEESGYWSLGSESVTMKGLEFEEVPIDSYKINEEEGEEDEDEEEIEKKHSTSRHV